MPLSPRKRPRPSRSPSPPPRSRTNTEPLSPTSPAAVEQFEEDNCAICLQAIVDRTVLPSCAHDVFCFECILVWTDQSRKCPLCNQTIGDHLIHNIRSAYDYQKHFLPPLKTASPPAAGAVQQQRRNIQSRRAREWGRRRDREREAEDELLRAVERRRWIYRNGLYAKHVASNTYTRYKPAPNPAQFSASPDLISRATVFLRRELLVWPNLDVEFLTTFVLSLLKSLDIRSEASIKLLAEFLDMHEGGRRNAEHFAHELYSYLRSPYRALAIYDTVVQYDLSVVAVPPSLHPPSERQRRWPSPPPVRSPPRRRASKEHRESYVSAHRRYERERSYDDYGDRSSFRGSKDSRYRDPRGFRDARPTSRSPSPAHLSRHRERSYEACEDHPFTHRESRDPDSREYRDDRSINRSPSPVQPSTRSDRGPYDHEEDNGSSDMKYRPRRSGEDTHIVPSPTQRDLSSGASPRHIVPDVPKLDVLTAGQKGSSPPAQRSGPVKIDRRRLAPLAAIQAHISGNGKDSRPLSAPTKHVPLSNETNTIRGLRIKSAASQMDVAKAPEERPNLGSPAPVAVVPGRPAQIGLRIKSAASRPQTGALEGAQGLDGGVSGEGSVVPQPAVASPASRQKSLQERLLARLEDERHQVRVRIEESATSQNKAEDGLSTEDLEARLRVQARLQVRLAAEKRLAAEMT